MKALNIGDYLILDERQYVITDVFCKSLSGNVYSVKDDSGEFFVIKEFIDEELTDDYRCTKTYCARFKSNCDISSSSALKLARKEAVFHRTALNNGSNNNPFVFSIKQYNTDNENGNGNMPYLRISTKSGCSLKEYINKHNNKDVAKSIKILKAVCVAVHTLHENNIMHLDLKPQNIYILEQGEFLWPLILDFGSAQKIGEVDLQTLALSGGTVRYASPRMVMLSNEFSVQAQEYLLSQICEQDDIYSICNILLEMFIGKTYSEVLDRFCETIDESEDEFLKNDLKKYGSKELQPAFSFIERMFSKLDDNKYSYIKNSDEHKDTESFFYDDLIILEQIVKHEGYHPENIRFFGSTFFEKYLHKRRVKIIPQMLTDIILRNSQRCEEIK